MNSESAGAGGLMTGFVCEGSTGPCSRRVTSSGIKGLRLSPGPHIMIRVRHGGHWQPEISAHSNSGLNRIGAVRWRRPTLPPSPQPGPAVSNGSTRSQPVMSESGTGWASDVRLCHFWGDSEAGSALPYAATPGRRPPAPGGADSSCLCRGGRGLGVRALFGTRTQKMDTAE